MLIFKVSCQNLKYTNRTQNLPDSKNKYYQKILDIPVTWWASCFI